MQEQRFYGHDGYIRALDFERQKRAEGYETALIAHPSYATQIVRYWRKA